MKLIHLMILAVLTLVLSVSGTISPATPFTPYTDPSYLTKIPFGASSHWLQPWRAYMETVPASTFLHGVGMGFNPSDSANRGLLAQMLAKHGIRKARVEISWNNLDFDDPTKLNLAGRSNFQSQLLALKKVGIRPLILLNAHHGVPGPVKFFERTLVANARKGDMSVQLSDTTGLRIGYSGLSNLSDYKAAEALITKVTGNTVTLSQPLPKDLKAGTSVPIATLKYRPFSPPDSQDYRETMAGWQNYVGTTAKFVAEVLGTTQSPDKGFDMEIWNELSFGSYFLYINSYYAQKPYKYHEDSIWGNLLKETAAYANAHPQEFQGVLFSDGLANTIPWPASSTSPARITGMSKHPYKGRSHYPQDNDKGTLINALGKEDKSGFVPKYSALFPEYYATALQTETLIRDMAPITTDLYDTKHGRNARVVNNTVVPNPIWITEVNISPVEDNPQISPNRALAVKAKTTARYYCFFLNKGATQLHPYVAADKDRGLGMVKENFLSYIEKSNVTYPQDDTVYTSPALSTLGRIVTKMSQNVETLQNTRTVRSAKRSLSLMAITDTHNHYQFAGDGTAAHPNLYNRDVFTFLPFQVNAHRFVIPYYVMTRDVMQDLPPEAYKVQIQGIKGMKAAVTAYDPLNDKNVPVVIDNRQSDRLSLQLPATDYPYLLTIEEADLG